MAEEQRTLMLQGIVYDTDRLNMIVGQLVDAARVAVGALELFPERVDVRALVENVARSAARDPDRPPVVWEGQDRPVAFLDPDRLQLDRKSTRLNSSHVASSYAVSCFKKKTTNY